MADLDNKRVLITGGTTGIGRAIAIELAKAGAKVFIFGRHQPELDDALRALAEIDGDVDGMTADQSKPEDVKAVFDKAEAFLGGFDAVIANAAISAEGLADCGDEEWRYAVATNFTGYLDVAKRAAERMKDQPGDIILIGSISGQDNEKGESVYSSTKAGIAGFAASFRKEMGEKNIRVSLIEPGAVGSDMQEKTPDQQRLEISKHKMLKAEDIAELVAFILSRPQRCTISEVRIEPRIEE
jgi:3-hydroxy acid dehydrogenase/malonic semialdehyde reductase